jgi:diguanylate cyclase (GGDEF)-like protein
MLNAFLMNLRHILEMHKYRIDLQNLYSTDQLTKLLNRKGFYRHMESVNENAIRNSEDIGLISIDMNWLKQINDTYGHKEGDFALAKIGEVMNVAIGDDGVCTRFGGDEFAIAFASKNGAERAEKIMESINSQIEKFNAGRTKPYPLSVSMGFVVGKPRKDGNIEPFIVDADRKMYANKTKFKEHNSWEDRKVQ